MTSNVVFRKKNMSDKECYIFILYFNGQGKKKYKSIKEKILEDYTKYFNKDIQQFILPKKDIALFNYKEINDKIIHYLKDFTIFDMDKTTIYSDIKSFISYFRLHNSLVLNPQTKNSYTSVLHSVEAFKVFKKKSDILFSDIDNIFVIELKNYLLQKTTPNTTLQYLTIIKSILNKAKRDGKYIEKYNYFSKLNIQTTYQNKKILNDSDIKTLLLIKKDENLFYYRNIFLFGLFSAGLRVSDVLLIKNIDIQKDYINILTKKTSKSLKVPYTPTLVNILADIFNLNHKRIDLSIYTAQQTGITSITKHTKDMSISDKNKAKEVYSQAKEGLRQFVYDELKQEIIKHVNTLNPNDYLFKDFLSKAPSLLKYDKIKEMTTLQHKEYISLATIYNYNLKKIKAQYNLDIEKISSHAQRYTMVSILLKDKEVNILDISKLLTHKSLLTTQNYIEKNFSKEVFETLVNKVSSKYTL